MTSEVEDLKKMLERLDDVYSVLFVITWVVCTMCSYGTIFFLFYRNLVKHVPNLLKICIAGFVFEEIAFGWASITIIVNEWSWHEFEQSYTYKVSFTLGALVFLTNHWLFTSHYLKVASLFKLTFSRHSEIGLATMLSRKKILWAVDIVAYIFLLGYGVVQLLRAHNDAWIVSFEALWAFYLCWIAPINMISMRHILKSAKSLERHGIYENSLIMRLYGLFWIMGLITMIIDLVFLLFARDNS